MAFNIETDNFSELLELYEKDASMRGRIHETLSKLIGDERRTLAQKAVFACKTEEDWRQVSEALSYLVKEPQLLEIRRLTSTCFQKVVDRDDCGALSLDADQVIAEVRRKAQSELKLLVARFAWTENSECKQETVTEFLENESGAANKDFTIASRILSAFQWLKFCLNPSVPELNRLLQDSVRSEDSRD